MQYRKMGRAGADIGVIGLGCEHLVDMEQAAVNDIVAAALDYGANYFDIFMPQGPVRSAIGTAIKGRRDKVMLCGHLGATLDASGQYQRSRDVAHCQTFVEDFCTRLGTETIDILMLHYIDALDDLDVVTAPGGLLDHARKLQQQGVCRFIGMSSHNALVSRKLVEMGALDVLMFSINPAFDMLPGGIELDDVFNGKAFEGLDPVKNAVTLDRQALYLACQRAGTAIVSMKTYGGGMLLAAEASNNAGIPPMTTTQLLHYALSQPGVASVLPGCRSVAEVQDAMAYVDATDAEKDFSSLLAASKWDLQGKCMYCNHCLPCPQGIDIAQVTRLLHTAQDATGDSDHVKAAYAALTAKGGDCIACEQCNDRCPFAVDAAANMVQAAAVFGV